MNVCPLWNNHRRFPCANLLPCIRILVFVRIPIMVFLGFLSTQEAVERRNHLFTLEKKRQLEKVGRIEKIEVLYKGIPEECTMVMNKDISTPFDCARRKYYLRL